MLKLNKTDVGVEIECAISGVVWATLNNIINNPTSIADAVAPITKYLTKCLASHGNRN